MRDPVKGLKKERKKKRKKEMRSRSLFADSLGVDLVDIRQPFGEDITWHLISKFVSKFRGFALCSGY